MKENMPQSPHLIWGKCIHMRISKMFNLLLKNGSLMFSNSSKKDQ